LPFLHLYIYWLYSPNSATADPSGRSLKREFAVFRFLELRIRIPPVAWLPVSCECCVCCQVEVSASGWSLVQRSPTECGVSEYDREASIMRRPWPIRDCCAIGKRKQLATKFRPFMGMILCTFWVLRTVPRSIPDRTTVYYKIKLLCKSCVPCAKNSANVTPWGMRTLIQFEGGLNNINSTFRIP
jgi:hypothetical protein